MTEEFPKSKNSRDLPVLEMKKNAQGTFELVGVIRKVGPIEDALTVTVRGGPSDMFSYTSQARKYAQSKNVKISFTEKEVGSRESKLSITLEGNPVDIQDVVRWHEEYVKKTKI